MKKSWMIPALLLTCMAAPVFAQDAGTDAATKAPDGLLSVDTMNYIGYGAIMLMLVLFIITMLVLLRTFKVLTRILLGPEAAKALDEEKKAVKAKPENSLVNKLLSLKPLSEEKSLIIEHDYDGIQELNNPTPAWFMALFYVTIAFAVVYIAVFHVFKTRPLQDEEYAIEMKQAEKEKEAFLANSANRVDETTVTLTADGNVLTAGQTIFKNNCAACHGDKGQGIVGPNLTDKYWLHGGKINDVFKTIKYGVQAKGMPNWDKQLTPKQISEVANYVKSLYGTNPPGAKEPQGDEYKGDDAAAPKTASL